VTNATAILDRHQRGTFEELGIVRVPGAFDAEAANAMCDVIWRELARQYAIDRDDRSTWRVEAPDHLQHLKGRPEFRAIASATTLGAIDDAFDGRAWTPPENWGAFFLLFPKPGAVPDVPTGSWHIDAPYGLPVRPLFGVKVFSLLADLGPGGGGTALVAGSHHVVERFGRSQPPETLAKNALARRALLRSHPWFAALPRAGDPAERVERFMAQSTDIDGLPVRVVELTGRAGDIVLVHPSVLHARPTNRSDRPRFMLSKDTWSRA
jgi:hypothetical protein